MAGPSPGWGQTGHRESIRRGHGSRSPHLDRQGQGMLWVSGQDPRREQGLGWSLTAAKLRNRVGQGTQTWFRKREVKSKLRETGTEIGAQSAPAMRLGSCLGKGLSSGPLKDWSRGPGTRRAGMRRALTRSRRRRRRRAAPAGRERPGPARARGACCRLRAHSCISSRHWALAAPPPAARGALNPGGAERKPPGE